MTRSRIPDGSVDPRPRSLLAVFLCAFLLAGCGGGGSDGGGGGGGGGSLTPTLTLSASPTTITAGGSTTLSWSTTNVTSCTASGEWSGSKSTSGSQSIALPAGSHTFTLSCSGAGGSISRSSTVTASAPAPLPELTFTSTHTIVTVTNSFTLTWTSRYAASCTASGDWTGPKDVAGSESWVAAGAGTVTFTLVCTGAGGSITRSVAVIINELQESTLTLTAPATVVAGEPFAVQWTTTNVTGCTAGGSWGGIRGPSGSQTFTALVPGTYVFSLACTGSGGGVTRSVTVTVMPAAIGQPLIVVTVMGFNQDAQVPELLTPGKTARAYVDVWNQAITVPVTDATVSINGTTLPFDEDLLAYEAELNVNPGETITASVTVNGTEYVASTTQFDTYPEITTPLDQMEWLRNVPNEIRWAGTSSRPGARVLLRMLGSNAAQDWPSGNWATAEDGATSHVVPADALSVHDYLLLVGYSDIAEFSGARSGSAFVLGGFSYRRVSVRNPPPPTNVTQLTFKTLPPVAVGVNGTRQLSVEATVYCCTRSDWTTKASWSTSDPNILSVNDAGLVTGVAPGTAEVTASYNGVSASITVRVHQPTPLPATPPTASTAFQVDHTHAGYLTLGTAPALPTTHSWTRSFTGKVSYPVVADGRVFVVADRNVPPNGVLGTSVYALDVNTGDILWGPIDHSSAYRWAAHTYANGRLFVITASGLLRALDAATGAQIWSVQMPGSLAYTAPPVAVNGLVYLASGNARAVFAVSQEDGETLWIASVASGGNGSPTLGSDGLYVSYPCDTYRLDPLSGDTLWRYRGSCSSGSGGSTAVLAGDKLIAKVSTPSGNGFTTFNASDGAIINSFAPDRPAVANGKAYVATGGQLRAIDIDTNATLWAYMGDPGLNTNPLVIDNMVAVGSSTGAVRLIDTATGEELWSDMAPGAVSPTSEGDVNMPAGLGAGGGYLLVPAGTSLTGWKLIP